MRNDLQDLVEGRLCKSKGYLLIRWTQTGLWQPDGRQEADRSEQGHDLQQLRLLGKNEWCLSAVLNGHRGIQSLQLKDSWFTRLSGSCDTQSRSLPRRTWLLTNTGLCEQLCRKDAVAPCRKACIGVCLAYNSLGFL